MDAREELRHIMKVFNQTAAKTAGDRLETLRKRAQEALENARAALKAERYQHYTLEHRQQTAVNTLKEGAASIRAEAQAWLEALAPERHALTSRGYSDPWPSAEDIARVEYARKLLEGKHASPEGVKELAGAWREALDAGDLITARVFADFAGVWWAAHSPLPNVGRPKFDELAAETTDKLLTDDQRQARTQLAELDGVIEGLQAVDRREAGDLDKCLITPDGDVLTVKDQIHAAMRQMAAR